MLWAKNFCGRQGKALILFQVGVCPPLRGRGSESNCPYLSFVSKGLLSFDRLSDRCHYRFQVGFCKRFHRAWYSSEAIWFGFPLVRFGVVLLLWYFDGLFHYCQAGRAAVFTGFYKRFSS